MKEEQGSSGTGGGGSSQSTTAEWYHELKSNNLDSSSAGPTLQAWVKLQHPISFPTFLTSFRVKGLWDLNNLCISVLPALVQTSPLEWFLQCK